MKSLIWKNNVFRFFAFFAFLLLARFSLIEIQKFETRTLFNKVKNNPRVYVYHVYRRELRNSYYVKGADDTILLISYYNNLSLGDTDACISSNFSSMPINLVLPTTYIYIYSKGSKVVELIDFNTKCWGYIKGFVYLPTMHTNPPPDSLAKKWILSMSRLPSAETGTPFHRGGTISDYGLDCD